MRAPLLAWLAAVSLVAADPCGMVPPIMAGNQSITRIGLQKTYVFYKDGIETIAIRPGFSGSVEDFGMLIPFPSPPALRKLPDGFFGQLAAAIDPPEVQLYANQWGYGRDFFFVDHATVTLSASSGRALEVHEVAVLNQEAVGMYEVAVLQAGSSAALQRWMDDHGFRYPDGMDGVCQEYVEDGWCFVAIKARVGTKAGVDPQPGMRDTSPGLAAGASFDGHVQAMAFRFRSEELVVPMRLSAFNEGALRNVVYLLSDQPMRIVGLPDECVRRQIPGEQLWTNLEQPLPLRVIGGDIEQISLGQLRALGTQRDPRPRNGQARQLFAGDLAAVAAARLSHPHEEQEKRLLAVGERLGLRGSALDNLHAQALEEQAEVLADAHLQRLQGMWLSVIDGDFPRELVASDNLRFEPWSMPAERNLRSSYEACSFAAAPEIAGSQLYDQASLKVLLREIEGQQPRRNAVWWLLLPSGVFAGLWLRRRRRVFA